MNIGFFTFFALALILMNLIEIVIVIISAVGCLCQAYGSPIDFQSMWLSGCLYIEVCLRCALRYMLSTLEPFCPNIRRFFDIMPRLLLFKLANPWTMSVTLVCLRISSFHTKHSPLHSGWAIELYEPTVRHHVSVPYVIFSSKIPQYLKTKSLANNNGK